MRWGFGEGDGAGSSRGAVVLDGVGGRAPRLLARVSEIMTSNVVRADPLTTVGRALALAERHGFCHVPVAWDDGEVVGMTCVCDLWPAKAHELIIQHMKVPVVSIAATDTVLRAAEVMRERNVGCLPVLDERRRLCGIVSLGDLMRIGAIGLDQLPPACMSCGSRHHVRAGVSRHTTTAVSYCVRCLGGGPRPDVNRGALPSGEPS